MLAWSRTVTGREGVGLRSARTKDAYRCWWRIVPQLVGAAIITLVGLLGIVAGVSPATISFSLLLLIVAVFVAVRAWLTSSIAVHPWGISAWVGMSPHRIPWSEIARFRVTEELSWYWVTRLRVLVVVLEGANDVVLSEFTSFPWPPGLGAAPEGRSLVDRTASALNERLWALGER
jgi:hypothetical protein